MPDDPFRNVGDHLTASPARGGAITPNDNADLAVPIRCINVATSGDVAVQLVGGDLVTYFVAAGVQFPMRAKKVFATGTTATRLVGSY
jgi:hypothetical protein